MSGLNISEEERKAILEKHKEATRQFLQKKAEEKAGMQFKKKPEEKPKEEKSKEEPAK